MEVPPGDGAILSSQVAGGHGLVVGRCFVFRSMAHMAGGASDVRSVDPFVFCVVWAI